MKIHHLLPLLIVAALAYFVGVKYPQYGAKALGTVGL